MPGLTEQRLIIQGLEQACAIKRVRLIEAVRIIDPPTVHAKVAVGTVLIAADVAPGITAMTKCLSQNQSPSERRQQLITVFLETPQLLRSLRRLLRSYSLK